jgi:tRNA threonylcarbamoyladenosine biosynthesis protein TsaB
MQLEVKANIHILSIDTSQKVCSVAISKNGEIIANTVLYNDKSASGLITPIIEQILLNCDLKPDALDAIAVGKGPGSYTGLRIAVSTAKGLCMAIEKPLIGINTLEGMAKQIAKYYPSDYLFCPMLDARRMEVFCAIYDSHINTIEETTSKIIDENSFSNLLAAHKIVFFGDGAAKCKVILSENKNAIFLENIFPNAGSIAELATIQYDKNQFENLVTFEPFYLKDFVGNIKES